MCVSKSKISVCIVKTANPGQEESGLVGDEHRDFCSNVSCLQLVHKREDNSINVGNDYTLVVIRFKLQLLLISFQECETAGEMKVGFFLLLCFLKCKLCVSKCEVTLHKS